MAKVITFGEITLTETLLGTVVLQFNKSSGSKAARLYRNETHALYKALTFHSSYAFSRTIW